MSFRFIVIFGLAAACTRANPEALPDDSSSNGANSKGNNSNGNGSNSNNSNSNSSNSNNSNGNGTTLVGSDGGHPPLDMGTSSSTVETCAAPAVCGVLQSYQICTTSGANCSERFVTSDGQSFACASCSNCQAAAQAVTNWCNGSVPAPTGDAVCAAEAQSDCLSCCKTNHAAGNTFFRAALQACECNTPGDCVLECATSLCAGTDTVSSLCSSCIDANATAGGDCDESTLCADNADCDALLSCANACPSS